MANALISACSPRGMAGSSSGELNNDSQPSQMPPLDLATLTKAFQQDDTKPDSTKPKVLQSRNTLQPSFVTPSSYANPEEEDSIFNFNYPDPNRLLLYGVGTIPILAPRNWAFLQSNTAPNIMPSFSLATLMPGNQSPHFLSQTASNTDWVDDLRPSLHLYQRARKIQPHPSTVAPSRYRNLSSHTEALQTVELYPQTGMQSLMRYSEHAMCPLDRCSSYIEPTIEGVREHLISMHPIVYTFSSTERPPAVPCSCGHWFRGGEAGVMHIAGYHFDPDNVKCGSCDWLGSYVSFAAHLAECPGLVILRSNGAIVEEKTNFNS